MKFIHAADLHIDSPLIGLELFDGAPIDRLRKATREAFKQLVELALAEEVDLVLIAGDLFDGDWRDMHTGVWTAAEFRRLERAGIPVCMLRGNHDAVSVVSKHVTWPENVIELSVHSPQSRTFERIGAVVHGQGFANRACSDDLAVGYPARIDGLFNIGMLHTSLSGSTDHDTYAPTTVPVLEAKGYDYWALGHIHQRQQFGANVPIHYCGNSQGRHARECGPKGCLLAEVDDLELKSIAFQPLDTLRWHRVDVLLDEDDHLDELYAAVQQRLRDCHDESGGRFCAVRVTVRGTCGAHRAIATDGKREEVVAEIRNIGLGVHDAVWIEKVRLETSPPIDLQRLRQGQDLLGDLLRTVEEISESEERLGALRRELKDLLENEPQILKDAGIDAAQPEQMRRWLKQAEELLIAQLLEPSS